MTLLWSQVGVAGVEGLGSALLEDGLLAPDAEGVSELAAELFPEPLTTPTMIAMITTSTTTAPITTISLRRR